MGEHRGPRRQARFPPLPAVAFSGIVAILATPYSSEVRAGQSQTYTLGEVVQAGDCFGIRLDMNFEGEITIERLGKATKLPLKGAAAHEYPERVISVGNDGIPDKAARIYETTKAKVTVAGGITERTLRDDRRLIVAQRHKGDPLIYSPAGALTRDELGLIGEHFDTLAVIGLLPGIYGTDLQSYLIREFLEDPLRPRKRPKL